MKFFSCNPLSTCKIELHFNGSVKMYVKLQVGDIPVVWPCDCRYAIFCKALCLRRVIALIMNLSNLARSHRLSSLLILKCTPLQFCATVAGCIDISCAFLQLPICDAEWLKVCVCVLRALQCSPCSCSIVARSISPSPEKMPPAAYSEQQLKWPTFAVALFIIPIDRPPPPTDWCFFDLQRWLDAAKPVRKQLRCAPPFHFYFRVKFYVVEPHRLQEEYTRWVGAFLHFSKLWLHWEMYAEFTAKPQQQSFLPRAPQTPDNSKLTFACVDRLRWKRSIEILLLSRLSIGTRLFVHEIILICQSKITALQQLFWQWKMEEESLFSWSVAGLLFSQIAAKTTVSVWLYLTPLLLVLKRQLSQIDEFLFLIELNSKLC